MGSEIRIVFIVNTEEMVHDGNNFNRSRGHDFLGGFVGVQSFYEFSNLFRGCFSG
jgi:hypothetical protein